MLQAILVFSFVNYEPAMYGKYVYPLWADSVGWMLTMSSVIPIFVVAIYKYVKADGDTVIEVRTGDVTWILLQYAPSVFLFNITFL